MTSFDLGIANEGESLAHVGGAIRRQCGRENERSGLIDQKVAQCPRSRDERSHRRESLPARMNGRNEALMINLRPRQPPAPWSFDADSVGFVGNHRCVKALA